MTASDKLQSRIGSMGIDGLAELMDMTSDQMNNADGDTHQALAVVRGFLMDELDRRDPEIVDAWIESGQDSLAAFVKPERTI